MHLSFQLRPLVLSTSSLDMPRKAKNMKRGVEGRKGLKKPKTSVLRNASRHLSPPRLIGVKQSGEISSVVADNCCDNLIPSLLPSLSPALPALCLSSVFNTLLQDHRSLFLFRQHSKKKLFRQNGSRSSRRRAKGRQRGLRQALRKMGL